jgi:hypothetical protein
MNSRRLEYNDIFKSPIKTLFLREGVNENKNIKINKFNILSERKNIKSHSHFFSGATPISLR